MTDHLHAAVLANGGEGVDRALEAVEGMYVTTGHGHLERLEVPYADNKLADLIVVVMR